MNLSKICLFIAVSLIQQTKNKCTIICNSPGPNGDG